MAVLTKRKDLSLQTNPHSTLYEIDTFKYIKSPEAPIENRIQLKVKKKFVHKDNIGYLFLVEVLERKQSNKEDVLGIEFQISNLQNKLLLYTNHHGEIISIVNRKEIANLWYDQKEEFKKTYKNDLENIDAFIDALDDLIRDNTEFLKLIKKTAVLILLFPPIYQHNLLVKNSVNQENIFYDFFDTSALPFKIDTKVVALNETTQGYQVVRAGNINTSRFDKESATSLISNLFDVHKYNIKIDANYFEGIDLSENDIVEEASFLLNVEASGVYSYRQMSKLKAI